MKTETPKSSNLTRQQLLNVSARLFHRKGFRGTSMQDIASDLGIKKGSIYYYISSKDDLLLELARTAMRTPHRRRRKGRFLDAPPGRKATETDRIPCTPDLRASGPVCSHPSRSDSCKCILLLERSGRPAGPIRIPCARHYQSGQENRHFQRHRREARRFRTLRNDQLAYTVVRPGRSPSPRIHRGSLVRSVLKWVEDAPAAGRAPKEARGREPYVLSRLTGVKEVKTTDREPRETVFHGVTQHETSRSVICPPPGQRICTASPDNAAGGRIRRARRVKSFAKKIHSSAFLQSAFSNPMRFVAYQQPVEEVWLLQVGEKR